jgi:hypothetical protein
MGCLDDAAWRPARLERNSGILIKEVSMKRVGMGIVLWLSIADARAQFLGGIFSQGATELKNNAAQLAALQALGMSTQEDFETLTAGLTGAADIHGAEYALHRQYFASLGDVSPLVAGMPEVADILSLAPAMRSGFSAALGRWDKVGGLAPAERTAMVEADSTLSGLVVAELQELQAVLTPGQLTMTDAERVARVRRIDAAVREQFGFMRQCCADGDLLAGERRQAARDAGALLGANGLQ